MGDAVVMAEYWPKSQTGLWHHRLRNAMFSIRPDEANFEVRGFRPTANQGHLETVGKTFVEGYNFALNASADEVETALNLRPIRLRGFFAEGAAMGTALSDLMTPWRNRLPTLFEQIGHRYTHLLHVGVGWASARIPLAHNRFARSLDPLLSWLSIDGRGFHDGYFQTQRVASGWRAVRGVAEPIYDQGVGRSLWFSCGADTSQVARAVGALPKSRANDLWAGVGLAAVYAGGAALDQLDRLAPGHSNRWLKQGASFAIAAHARAGEPPCESAQAAYRITGLDWRELVELVNAAEKSARAVPLPSIEQYHLWRSLVADSFEKRCA
jgi:enediyne biosynthesis protein E3